MSHSHQARTGAVIAVAAAFVGLLTFGLTKQGPDRTVSDALAAGERPAVRPFDLEVLARGDLQGGLQRLEAAVADGRLELAELRGTPVVLNVWASWCEPCRAEAPLLQSRWLALRRRGVLVLGLDIRDAREDARAFIARYGLTYPSVREPDNLVARSLGSTGVPETFFIDANGRIAARTVGAVDADDLDAGVRAATAGRP